MANAWPWASPGMADAMAREDYREAREDEARQVARAEAEDARAQAAAHAARVFEYEHGYSQSEWRQAVSEMAVAAEQRRAGAEYGSAQRAAVLIDGVELRPRETAAPPPRADEDDRLLAEARRSSQDPFMRGQVQRLRQRQGREVSRSRPFDVIGRAEECRWCIEQNVSDEQSYLLHHDPEYNVPVTPPLAPRPEPDRRQAEADRLRRLGYSAPTAALAATPYPDSATGWPVIVR
jgi:hypothetical protein